MTLPRGSTGKFGPGCCLLRAIPSLVARGLRVTEHSGSKVFSFLGRPGFSGIPVFQRVPNLKNDNSPVDYLITQDISPLSKRGKKLPVLSSL